MAERNNKNLLKKKLLPGGACFTVPDHGRTGLRGSYCCPLAVSSISWRWYKIKPRFLAVGGTTDRDPVPGQCLPLAAAPDWSQEVHWQLGNEESGT